MPYPTREERMEKFREALVEACCGCQLRDGGWPCLTCLSEFFLGKDVADLRYGFGDEGFDAFVEFWQEFLEREAERKNQTIVNHENAIMVPHCEHVLVDELRGPGGIGTIAKCRECGEEL